MSNQQVLNPDALFCNTEKQDMFITGSEAVKEAIKRSNVDMAISYPITPQSESMHLVGDLYAQGYLKDYLRGENELAVMSEVAGASMGGVRVFTATGGPGTLRAFEMFSTWSGARLPIVCAFMTRGLNSPLTIQPDNIEMAHILDTGMIILHAENAQDLYDMLLKAFIVAEKPDVHIPVGVFADGFFVTHTRDRVRIDPESVKLPPYDPYSAPVPVIDMENVPVRLMRDPFVMKSNFISYAAHASWQQEIMAAAMRSRKYLDKYLEGLMDIHNEKAKVMVVASGTAVSQSREAVERAKNEGMDVGLIKIKCLRPFPVEKIKAALENVKTVIIPEFNRVGWLYREIKSVLQKDMEVIGAPRVFGGMTMPAELILDEIRRCQNG